jgi:hypothetical protein
MERAGHKLWPYFGASYVITARKKVSTMTPIKPRWQPRSAVVPGLADSARYNSRTVQKQELTEWLKNK